MIVYKWFKRGKLYAMTNDKKYYKVFTQTRNPKVFDFIEDEVSDINEYIEIANYNMGNVLRLCDLKTADNKERTKIKKIPFVLTENEVSQITERLGIAEILDEYDGFHEIFHAYGCLNKKILNALKTLEFKDMHILMDRDEYYLTESFDWDTCEIFLTLFGNTMNTM